MLQKHDLKSAIPVHGEQWPRPEPSMLPAWFLALGTFAIGTEGFMIAPLLPTIAADLGMSLSATAMLVVVFTLVLALSSPIATVITGGLRRRDTLLLAMTIFTVGNLIAAFAPGFGTLMFARVLMAVAAGLYAPNANALAGMIVPTEKRGRALAIISGGMTIAIALGLPLGSIIGHAFGWRSTFLMVAATGAIAGMAAVSVALFGIAGWGFSVSSFFPARMARLIVAGGQGQASVALSLNTSTMYLGFSIGSAIGAGIIAAGNVWMIGAAAAVMALAALALNAIWRRNGN